MKHIFSLYLFLSSYSFLLSSSIIITSFTFLRTSIKHRASIHLDQYIFFLSFKATLFKFKKTFLSNLKISKKSEARAVEKKGVGFGVERKDFFYINLKVKMRREGYKRGERE